MHQARSGMPPANIDTHSMGTVFEQLVRELPGESQFSVYQTEDGATVWLPQPIVADLFQTTQQNISMHLRNIHEEGELQPEATHKEFLSVRRKGSRDVRRRTAFHNLNAIISVGYPVKSRVATQFRMWPPSGCGSTS